MDKSTLLSSVISTRAELDSTIAGLSDQLLAQPGVSGEMSVKDILAHITWFEREMISLLEQRALAGSDLWNLPSDADLKTPSALHPAFYGHYDWHSSVHAHWMLVRLLRLFPQLDRAAAIRERLDEHLQADKLQAEADYFDTRENRSFERMYGWAWALRLAQELRSFDDPQARRWAAAFVPLEQQLVGLTRDYLPRLSYPIRTGVHPDTAFAMAQMIDYARATGDMAFEAQLLQRARDYYSHDRDYPSSFEPSGQDFFSAGLNVADLMRRVLSPKEFSAAFLIMRTVWDARPGF